MLVSSASLPGRLSLLAFAAFGLIAVLWWFLPSSINVAQHFSVPSLPSLPSSPKVLATPRINHPIEHLILKAQEDFRATVSKETRNLHDAAKAYRERRARQPPPGFDAWFAYAQNSSAMIVEDFFDRIYEDLNPFWGVPAKQVREQAHSFEHRISVREGTVTAETDTEREWMKLWKEMVQSVAAHLPDLDLPINVMDESRVVVPWEEIDGYMTKEQASRKIVPEDQLKTTFGDLKHLDKNPPESFDPQFNGMGPYWNMAVEGCPPDSPARKAYIETDFKLPPPLSKDFPAGSAFGYIQNWTLVQDPCQNPSLQGLHGTFVEPISISTTKKFMPLFGGSKLQMNNEILLPPAMYWTEDPFYSGGEEHGQPWKAKKDKLIWRGDASGGRNKEENWTRFQRHRFVSMVNATSVRQLEEHPDDSAPNFVLPSKGWELSVQQADAEEKAFSDWVSTWSDVAFVYLHCFPDDHPPYCPYTDPYFAVAKRKPMKEQYVNKYLADIDGSSFSGRYRGFLRSNSLPIKATIYKEWHDNRLFPWKHFVPMDNTFIDIYGIMEFFAGNKLMGLNGQDEVAKIIALDGKAWAEKVLRKEDMSVYVLRLLLEYARLCDDEREKMGFAEGDGT